MNIEYRKILEKRLKKGIANNKFVIYLQPKFYTKTEELAGAETLDCSKAIALGAKYDGDPWDLVIHRDRIGKKLPVFDVMTMAATGSEYDGAGVITNDETKEKLSVGGCFPVASILDPTYTMTVPAKQTAAGLR